ncbi:hypothetical protein FRC17_001069, partial [Serendipita sp. 399]
MSESLVLIDLVDPPTPAPSTVSFSSSQSPPPQQQFQQVQYSAQEALYLSDVLYSLAFTILWLFGYARNLASYVVSLGIIPFRTARQIFGIDRHQPIPLARPGRDKPSTPRVSNTSTLLDPPSSSSLFSGTRDRPDRLSRTTRRIGNPHSPLLTDSSHTRTQSVPSSPYLSTGGGIALPKLEPETDVDHASVVADKGESVTVRRSKKHRNRPDRGLSVDGELEARQTRSKIDHSTRRILFVDPKQARRQTAPPAPIVAPLTSEESVGSNSRVVITQSPAMEPTVLPPEVENIEKVPSSHSIQVIASPKTSPGPSRPNSTNEFGEFVSAPSQPSPTVDRGNVSCSESISEKKERSTRGSFKLFGRKRSSSVSSSTRVSDAEPPHLCPRRLRRKSPFPARPGEGKTPGVSQSDAEGSHHSSLSMSWFHSKPRRLTRRRSNSLSGSQSPAAASPRTSTTGDPSFKASSPMSDIAASSPASASLTQKTSNCLPSQLSRSNTSSSALPPSTPGRSRFNPIRDLELHLYTRHGFGTGPSDTKEWKATPRPGYNRVTASVFTTFAAMASYGPRLPERLVDAPSQRLYILSLALALQAVKLLSFFGSLIEGPSVKLFFKWMLYDVLFLLLLRFMRIPRLTFRWKSTVLQAILLGMINWLLFGNYKISFSGASLVPALFYDVWLRLRGDYVGMDGYKVSITDLFRGDKHLLGQHTVKLTPISTARLNPYLESFCIPEGVGHTFVPILFNNSEPSHITYSSASLHDPNTRSTHNLRKKEILTRIDTPQLADAASSDDSSSSKVLSEDEAFDIEFGEYDDPRLKQTHYSQQQKAAVDKYPALQKTQRLRWIKITKPGTIKLETVQDGRAEVRLRDASVTIVQCPTAKFTGPEDEKVRCRGDKDKLFMETFG